MLDDQNIKLLEYTRMKEQESQTQRTLNFMQDHNNQLKTQVNQILQENEALKSSNLTLNKKLEGVYKDQMEKRKSSIGVKKSMSDLCDSVEKVRISQEKKRSLLHGDIAETQNHADTIEQLENFQNENLRMYQEIETLKNEKREIQSEFESFKLA